MSKIWEFIVYALHSAMNIIMAAFGEGEFTDTWIKDGIVGLITIIIIMLFFYWIFRLTRLLKIE